MTESEYQSPLYGLLLEGLGDPDVLIDAAGILVEVTFCRVSSWEIGTGDADLVTAFEAVIPGEIDVTGRYGKAGW